MVGGTEGCKGSFGGTVICSEMQATVPTTYVLYLFGLRRCTVIASMP